MDGPAVFSGRNQVIFIYVYVDYRELDKNSEGHIPTAASR